MDLLHNQQEVKKAVDLTHPAPAPQDTPLRERGRSERSGEAYFGPYVEPHSYARTTLAAFFNILLRGLGVPLQDGHSNVRLRLSPEGRPLAHPIAIDDRIDNVAAGNTA